MTALAYAFIFSTAGVLAVLLTVCFLRPDTTVLRHRWTCAICRRCWAGRERWCGRFGGFGLRSERRSPETLAAEPEGQGENASMSTVEIPPVVGAVVTRLPAPRSGRHELRLGRQVTS